jgi:hypothetical protein
MRDLRIHAAAAEEAAEAAAEAAAWDFRCAICVGEHPAPEIESVAPWG